MLTSLEADPGLADFVPELPAPPLVPRDTQPSGPPSEPFELAPAAARTIAAQIADLQRGLEVVIRRSTPPPASRPSMGARALKGGGKGLQWLVLASGAVALVGQVVRLANNPELGPLVVAIEAIGSALLGVARAFGGGP